MPCLDSYGPLKRPQFPHAQEGQKGWPGITQDKLQVALQGGISALGPELLDLQKDGRYVGPSLPCPGGFAGDMRGSASHIQLYRLRSGSSWLQAGTPEKGHRARSSARCQCLRLYR